MMSRLICHRLIRTVVAIAIGTLTLMAGPSAEAMAKPHSVKDCEKIKAALAYNACLAMFGPERRHPVTTRETPPANQHHYAGHGHHAAKAGSSHVPKAAAHGRRANGKKYAVFNVSDSKKK